MKNDQVPSLSPIMFDIIDFFIKLTLQIIKLLRIKPRISKLQFRQTIFPLNPPWLPKLIINNFISTNFNQLRRFLQIIIKQELIKLIQYFFMWNQFNNQLLLVSLCKWTKTHLILNVKVNTCALLDNW